MTDGVRVDNHDCPACGEETLHVSIEALLSGVDEVMLECSACEAVFGTDIVFGEEDGTGPEAD